MQTDDTSKKTDSEYKTPTNLAHKTSNKFITKTEPKPQNPGKTYYNQNYRFLKNKKNTYILTNPHKTPTYNQTSPSKPKK